MLTLLGPRPGLRILFLVLLLPFFTTADADHGIDADASGNWANPEQPGHGLQIEVLPNGQALVAWYVYDENGQSLWLFGQGLVQGRQFSVDLDRRQGAFFPPAFDPDDVTVEAWGSLIFELEGCNEARIAWQADDPAFGAGELALVRVSRIDGLGCRSRQPFEQTVRFTLDQGKAGFDALFLDYPEGEEAFFELDWGHSTLPEPWAGRGGIFLTGANRSDDLLMLLKRPLDGLQPDTTYQLQFEVQLASDVPSNCFGIGGSPGESVYLKAGAADREPDVVLEDSGLPDVPPMRRPSFDIGQQSQPGEYSVVMGNLANGQSDELCANPDRPWVLMRLSSESQDYSATTDSAGRLWVYAFSDSGFEGTSTWYLTEMVIRLQPDAN